MAPGASIRNDHQVSAAWMSDEVSWRITMCGRSAAIPLRITALYAHDGDRWVAVFEHLSFARTPAPYFDANGNPELRGLSMKDAFVDHALAEYPAGELPLAALLSGKPAEIQGAVSLDPLRKAEDDPTQPAPTLLLAPDADSEWHGDEDISRAQLVDGPIRPEDRRVGIVGPSVKAATIAYWVGNFIADLPARPGIAAGKVRLRGTFVFEKRADKWLVVQGHVSEPFDDRDLAQDVFGTALVSEKPLQLDCSDGATAPAAAR